MHDDDTDQENGTAPGQGQQGLPCRRCGQPVGQPEYQDHDGCHAACNPERACVGND